MKVGYYKILDIEHTATDQELKKAFHKLAHLYHPDKPTGHEERFKIINECYQTLIDPEKRRLHDIEFGVVGQPFNKIYVFHPGWGYGSPTTTHTSY